MIRVVLLLAALVGSLVVVGPAEAYIGPKAGFAFLSSFLVLIASFLLAILSLLLWPFRLIMNHWRGRRSGRGASVERVVIVGLDGLDPSLATRYMAEGKLPNLTRLEAQGTFAISSRAIPETTCRSCRQPRFRAPGRSRSGSTRSPSANRG